MYPCRRVADQPLTRRDMLQRSACGFGAVALSGLLTDRHYAAGASGPFAPLKPHFAPKCSSVIYLYMDGGPTQVDTWDPKPQLQKDNGKPFFSDRVHV